MNTVKIIKLKAGFACEFHGSGPISIQEYSGFATGDMANDAAEWCSRTTQVASTEEGVPIETTPMTDEELETLHREDAEFWHGDQEQEAQSPSWHPTKEELDDYNGITKPE